MLPGTVALSRHLSAPSRPQRCCPQLRIIGTQTDHQHRQPHVTAVCEPRCRCSADLCCPNSPFFLAPLALGLGPMLPVAEYLVGGLSLRVGGNFDRYSAAPPQLESDGTIVLALNIS